MLVTKTSAAGLAMGLVTDSIVVADNLATVVVGAVRKKIGACIIMTQVDEALRTALRL